MLGHQGFELDRVGGEFAALVRLERACDHPPAVRERQSDGLGPEIEAQDTTAARQGIGERGEVVEYHRTVMANARVGGKPLRHNGLLLGLMVMLYTGYREVVSNGPQNS